MGILTLPSRSTVRTRWDGSICHLQIHRPEAQNTIDAALLADCASVLDECEQSASVLVVEGLPEVFCMGADFREQHAARQRGHSVHADAQALYGVWLRLNRGPFVSIAHVRGRANAGGVGFAAACDLVICDSTATFSLSELLFGLEPACVLPFLIKRVGLARAHAMTLTTQPVSAAQAHAWGLVDACGEDSSALLHRHLLRLRLLPRHAVARHKRYIAALDAFLESARTQAVACNVEAFSDAQTVANIERYVNTGQFPWENVTV